MWLVRIALSRPYTFIVLALLLLIIGILSILRTPTDIFPSINIPVISIVWNYTGLPPDEMANRITSVFERAVTTTVNNIEHIESESLIGVNVIKLFFQPNTEIALALGEVTAVSQTMLRLLPPGTLPPLILSYDASTVPILQLVLSSPTLSEQDLNDLGNNFIRTQLATVQGAALPFPYGGKVRQIMVDLNSQAMQTYGVSAEVINQAISQQSLIIPAGTQKIGPYEYIVKLNNSPLTMEGFNNLPVKTNPNQIIYLRDVAHVRDGFAPQTNIVRVNDTRAVMMSILKTGKSSTLDIIKKIKEILPIIKENMPKALHLTTANDQSVFVLAAIKGVIIEAITAGLLTALMILLFLGSLRSTFIITVSIPLSMLASLSVLSMMGETINIMTLGGLALAVGILVDDATVAIENINWNLDQGKNIEQAILDGAQQIAVPALVSTLCICIVFVPMFFLGGIAQYLFVPLAKAVVFAMLASYLLSRTLVPTMANYLLKPKVNNRKTKNIFANIHHNFEQKFENFRQSYHNLLLRALRNSKAFILYFMLIVLVSILLLWPRLGSNFFPQVDAGSIKIHARTQTGTRVEESARLAGEIDEVIRKIIPADELENIVDNIGLPTSGINLSYSNSGTSGPQDMDILISLKPKHRATEFYVHKIRESLSLQFPGLDFSFLPADIVNQILNFGLPSPVSIQIAGLKEKENDQYANKLIGRLKRITGLVDIRKHQANNYPEFFVDSDRNIAKELGFTQGDIAASLLLSLSGSFQTTPNFWIDPKTGVSYPIVAQTPQYAMNSLETLRNIPITNIDMSTPQQILGALSRITRTQGPVVVSHYNVQPLTSIYAANSDRDLGSVTQDIYKVLNETKKEVPKGTQVMLQGQIDTQHKAFTGLYIGLIFSIVLIYLLIVINFQSWLDPFIIITALPAAIAGIAWMLFLTHTTLSVPALTGVIMCMGVATANSILVISFARQHMHEGNDPLASALEAGFTRLRPVLMTATAMIIGMLPMSLGLGEGGEQNAPLGRAVIGGLSFATISTLFFVPAVFTFIHSHRQSIGKKHA
jgi:CzcA family heavy metal efflux pump